MSMEGPGASLGCGTRRVTLLRWLRRAWRVPGLITQSHIHTRPHTHKRTHIHTLTLSLQSFSTSARLALMEAAPFSSRPQLPQAA
jgi:hypothetical protein